MIENDFIRKIRRRFLVPTLQRGNENSFMRLEMFQHRQGRRRLVERVKMHTRCAKLNQAFAQLCHNFFAEGLDAGFVIAKTGEFEQNPAGDFGAAGF